MSKVSERPARADARRNYDRLLTEAATAFAEHGTGAALEDIARRADVGIGTLYRHFPTREALLEAVLRGHFTELETRANELLASSAPMDALVTWLDAFIRGTAAYRGLADELIATLRDEDSALHASCQAMRTASFALLDRAQRAGAVRTDIDPDDVVAVLHGVAWASERIPDGPQRIDGLLALVLDGLRTT